MEQYKNLVPSSVMKESFIIKKLYTYNDPLYIIKHYYLNIEWIENFILHDNF